MSKKINPKLMEIVRKKQEKAGIKYAKVGGGLYNAIKIFFYIFAAYNLVLNILYLLSTYVDYELFTSRINNPTTNQLALMSEIKNSIITMAVLSLCLVVAVVFLILKKHVPFGVFLVLSGAIPIVHYYQRMSESIDVNGILPYFLKHALPLFLYLVFGGMLVYIALRHNTLDKKAYQKIIDYIYKEYAAENFDQNEEQWEDYLANYQPVLPRRLQKRLDKKRSRKKAGKKQNVQQDQTNNAE